MHCQCTHLAVFRTLNNIAAKLEGGLDDLWVFSGLGGFQDLFARILDESRNEHPEKPGRHVKVPLLNSGVSLQDRLQDGSLGDGERVLRTGLLDHDEIVANDGLGGALNDNGVDGQGNRGVLENESVGTTADLVGENTAGGQDGLSGLAGEGSVGDLDLLGDLVGENGDSEDGGEAGNGEDGSDDNSNLHALDGTFNVGQLSLEAGHGGSSFSFHFWF